MARDHIRDKRKALNLSQGALGKIVGLTGTSISSIEKGYRDIGHQEAIKLSDALGMNVSEVIGIDSTNKRQLADPFIKAKADTASSISDTNRLEALISNEWKVEVNGQLYRVRNVTPWLTCPRAAIDKAIEIKSITTRSIRQRPDPLNGIGVTWRRWETLIFPKETKRGDIFKSGRIHGWKVSVSKIRSSGEWKAMAMDPISRRKTTQAKKS